MLVEPLNLKVLIADRLPYVATAIANSLKSQGYLIVGIAHSGEDAVKQTSTTRPDIVLMDITLNGEMDGIEAAWKIRSELFRPVIYTVAAIDEVILRRAKSTDPYGYLLKPFSLQDLQERIEIAIQKHCAFLAMQEWADEQFLTLLNVASRMKPMPRILFVNETLVIYVLSRGRAEKLKQQCMDLCLPYTFQIFSWEKSLEQYQLYANG